MIQPESGEARKATSDRAASAWAERAETAAEKVVTIWMSAGRAPSTVMPGFSTRRIDAKRARKDPEGFARLAAASSNLPFAAIIMGWMTDVFKLRNVLLGSSICYAVIGLIVMLTVGSKVTGERETAE